MEVWIPELFEQQVRRTPEGLAVVCEQKSLTYRELNERANQLAHRLRSHGVGPDVLVGLCLERSWEMTVAILAILKAGGAYVPLDPAYPPERLAYILKDACVSTLVTRHQLLKLFPDWEGTTPTTAERPHTTATDQKVVCMDALEEFESDAASGLLPLHRGENLVYVMYTSGSTGRPKGVLIPHRALSHHANAVAGIYKLAAGDRVLQFASLSFDVAAEEIFPAWIRGATVVLRSEEAAKSFDQFLRFVNKHRVTVLNLPASWWHELVGELERSARELPPSVRLLITGNEKVSSQALTLWQTVVGPRIRWINAYGPTEATITATIYEPDLRLPLPQTNSVPIGRPLPHMEAHVLDEQLQPVTEGQSGELHLSGAGLAHGYLNQPELTAAKFIPHPFREQARLYKTGDRVRILSDGNIEFIGRVDEQVKIRGFRIEPGEVECALLQSPLLKQAVVVARPGASGSLRLVAYLVPQPGQSVEIDPLRQALKANLPEYMVPSAFVPMQELPLTPSGKIDRNQLPEPEPDRPELQAGYVAPRTAAERRLAEIWCEVLGVKQVGVHQNFFELGGDSLMAIRLLSRMGKSFQIELPLSILFERPTIAGLAEGLSSSNGEIHKVPPLIRHDRDQPIPLSFTQRRLWFIHQLDPAGSAYNETAAVLLEGPLDAPLFKECLNQIVARHEILRTRFPAVEGAPVQSISPTGAVELNRLDLQAHPQAEKEARQQAAELAKQPFDLAEGPLLRCTLFALAPNRHFFSLVIPHIICDGWSLSLFFSELGGLYQAQLGGGKPALPNLPIQYADFAAWQRGWMRDEVLQTHQTYWKNNLSGAPASLELPTDHPGSAETASDGARQSILLPAPLTQALQELNRREASTPFLSLLSALVILLHKWTRQSDLVLGTVVAGRGRPELENLLGCFLNCLPLRIQLNGSETGRDILTAVKASLLEAHRHVDCPFEKIVETVNPERRRDRNPIYNVGFLLHNFPRTVLATGELTGTFLPLEREAALLDLRFIGEEDERGLSLSCDYRMDLFEPQTISALMEAFAHILQRLLEAPQMELAGFELPEGLAQRSVEARAQAEQERLAITGTFALEPLEEPLQFWVKKLDLPVQLQFAPYNQIFQQLLDPASLLGTNRCGLNVILLRIEDWQRDIPASDGLLVRERLTEHLTELISALSTASARHAIAHLVCLCPSSKAAAAHPANLELLQELEAELVRALGKITGVYLATSQELTRLYPVTEVYDPHEDVLGHVPYTPVYFAALATLIIRKFHALKQPQRKVIALDCDDTLWTGICGEEAPANLKLEAGRAALQAFMRAQLDSGMLLCLCSKNNPSDVDAVFAVRDDFVLRAEHFSARRINWRSKSANLKSLASELNLGLDSFVFIDDNPLECAEVEANCPEVLALQLPQAVEQIEDFLKHCWAFDRLKVTAEDKQRTALYQQNRLREDLRVQSNGLAEFVARLELKVEINALDPERLERVAQLTQRTNQFNLSTRRRTEAQLQELQQRDGMQILTVSVRDRFGEYGLVGALIFKVEAGRLSVDSFLLSCRVLGRGVEHQMLAHLGRIAVAKSLAEVDIYFEPTLKNKPAGDFLEKTGAAWRQPLNGGFLFRFPAEAASAVRFEAALEERAAAEARADSPKRAVALPPANPWARVGSHLRWIAAEANDAAKILEQIETSACAAPVTQADYVAPRTDVERQLCELWQGLFRIERVGVRDDFFQMGGHSLQAVRLFGQVEKLTGKKLPVVTIFQAPTVELLAAVIAGQKPAAPDSAEVPIQPGG